jgi:hypothetical protein
LRMVAPSLLEPAAAWYFSSFVSQVSPHWAKPD